MDEIEEFAKRHGLNAAELSAVAAAGGWSPVVVYLQDHGVDTRQLSRAEIDAITEAVHVVAYSAWVAARAPVAAPEAPADAPEAKEPEAAPESRAEPATGTEALERVRSILQSPEAKGRESFAQHLALGGALSAPEAVELLKTVPASGTMPAPQAPAVTPRRGNSASLVRCDPSSWLPPQLDTSRKAEWSNVLAKLNGGSA